MRTISLSVASAILAILSLNGCGFPQTGAAPPAASPAEVASVKAQFPTATDAQIQEGHDMFVAKCNKCHSHPDLGPSANAKVEWDKVVVRMGKKADLTDDQTNNVLHYVLGVRAAAAPATPATPATPPPAG
jgi:cytochrome c5